jgi:hypothetical protein
MLQSVSKIPAKYYQLAILNAGLLIALSKELSLLHILSSLAFMVALTAPLAIYFKLLQPNNIQIVHDEVQAKLNGVYAAILGYLKNWDQVDEEKRAKYIIHVLQF